ncbi:TPA: hypothetical protein R4958_001437 [Campylobacter jejuni]|nr:hypothetical protein [Campylobacter jejuni]
MEKLKFELREYKGFRYVVAPVQSWQCGYLLIDKQLFKDLELDLYSNHTSSRDGEITWIQNKELGDKDFEGQKENEMYFGIDTNHIWSHNKSAGHVDNVMKEWIDWIADNKSKLSDIVEQNEEMES